MPLRPATASSDRRRESRLDSVNRRMRPVFALVLLLASCARAPRVAEVRLPAPIVIERTVIDTPPPPPDTMVSFRVPAFLPDPLIEWGAAPPGEPRAERQRAYDLQHQDTRVRFDWARRAVVGTTTIRVAALDSG